jgi:hypothetical protein
MYSSNPDLGMSWGAWMKCLFVENPNSAQSKTNWRFWDCCDFFYNPLFTDMYSLLSGCQNIFSTVTQNVTCAGYLKLRNPFLNKPVFPPIVLNNVFHVQNCLLGCTAVQNNCRPLFCTAVHPSRQFWTSYSPPWELEISQTLKMYNQFVLKSL